MPAGEAVEFACPNCGAETVAASVQGDRCAACGVEFKRFAPGERRTAEDYFAVLTGRKHLLELPDARGWIVAHE